MCVFLAVARPHDAVGPVGGRHNWLIQKEKLHNLFVAVAKKRPLTCQVRPLSPIVTLQHSSHNFV